MCLVGSVCNGARFITSQTVRFVPVRMVQDSYKDWLSTAEIMKSEEKNDANRRNSGGAASDERAGEVAHLHTLTEESQPDDYDDVSTASAADGSSSDITDEQERRELFNEGVALGFQLGYAAALEQATSSGAAATTSQTTTGNLVEDTLQSPGALTGRRVPLYERSGEGERAPASGLVALAQSGGEDAGPARPDGDES